MPRLAARVISSGMAKMHELQTIYDSRDLYDMIEILAVDSYNRNVRADA
jgi:hypothetical protein